MIKARKMSVNNQALPESHKIETYEAAIAELEMIVNKMEAGNLPLEESLNSYKRGTELLKMCQQSLADVEQQVSILSDSNTLSPIMVDTENPK